MHVVEIDHEVDAVGGAVHDNNPRLRGVGRVLVEPGLPQIRLDQGPLLLPHRHHPLVATLGTAIVYDNDPVNGVWSDCGGNGTKLYRSAVVLGKLRKATTNTSSVPAGSAPAKVTVPLMLVASGIGWRPWSQRRTLTRASGTRCE